MAFYRANYLEFQGINQSKGVPNVQRHQIGQALDYTDLDEYDRPNVTYSWNRNIHDKDMATKRNYVAPVHHKQASSADTMRMSAAEHTTKAYKDGQEYIKAERDFRAKERYLDSITPSRRNHTVSIGTSTSTSGLPIPDVKGNVFHYDAATTAQTGMRFEAPHNLPEVPQSADQLNSNSKRINPVILTREKAISIDNATGSGSITFGSSSVLKPPVVSNPFEYTDPAMPGAFPDMKVVDVKRDEEMEDAFYVKSEPVETKPEIALTTINDPREVEDIIANTEMARNDFVAVQAHSPFANLRQKPYSRKPPKKEKLTVERAVLRTVDAAQERVAVGGVEPSREVQVETINPRVRGHISTPFVAQEMVADRMDPFREIQIKPINRRVRAQTLVPTLARGVKRGGDAEVESERRAQKPRVGNLPEAYRLNPSIKRVALAGAPGRPTIHKKQRTDADVQEITLKDLRAVTKRGRKINAQIDPTAVIDPRPPKVETATAGFLRPIAKLRGQPEIDYAIPPNFQVNPVVEEATGLRKKRPVAAVTIDMSGLNSRTLSGLQNLEDTNLISPVVSGNMKAFTANSKITGFQKIAADTVENKNGELLVNDVTSIDPVTISTEDGVATVGLEINDKYLLIDEGALAYKPDEYDFPLSHDTDSKTVELVLAAPFGVTEEGLSMFYDNSLEINNGDLSVVRETLQAPLARDANGVKLLHDESLTVQHGLLKVDYNDPLFIDSDSKLTLDYDESLVVDTEGKLSVVPETLTEPIARGEDGSITFKYGRGLKVEEGELVSNTEDVLKPLGALHNGGIFDMGMDELTELGYDALADLTDEVPDTDITLLRLRTSDDFTQKNTLATFGGKALAIKSQGNHKIPFYGVFDGFNVSSRFEYNDTLSELSVPHVELNQNFNPNSNEAVTQSYVAQYIQSGSAIDVAPETNNKRLLNVRTDATLQVDANNNLGVNVSPLVNGSSVKIDGNGKISGGYIFQSANGVRLREGTNNDVVLALNVEGALEKVGLNTIKENMTFGNGLKRTGNSVALDLQGSEHIQVSGNTVSTTLKPYTAGQNVTISNNTISVNIPEETPYSGGAGISIAGKTISNTTQIRAGTGITVFGSPAIGWTISSQNLKQNDDDDDEKKTDNEDDTLKNENNEVVQTTSPTSLIFPIPLIPIPPIPPIPPLVPIFPIIGVLPSLLGFLGGFAVIFGYQRERKKKKNADGTDQVDENGNPIYELDDDGNYIWSEGSNVVIHSDKDTRRTTLMFDSWPEDVRVGRWCYGMNLEKTWEFEEKISRPWTIETVSSLVQPLDMRLVTAESSLENHATRLSSAEVSLGTIGGRVSTVESKVSVLEANSPLTVGKGLLKNSNVISINPYQSETISAIGDIVFGMQRWVPSTVFFTDSEPSTTTVSGEAWGNDNVNRGHKAFANWGGSLWFTNLYTGVGGTSSRTTSTTAGGISYAGEWLQIQLPAAKSISAVRVRYRDGGDIRGCPQTFAVLGSNDGTTWNVMYHQSTPVGWTEQNRDPKWFNMTTSTAYSYLRLEYFTPLDSVTINKPLFIGNGLTGSNATFSKTITAEAAPTIGTHLVNKTFTDGLTLSNNVLGYDSSVISTKASTDALTTRVGTAESSITSLQTGKQNSLSVSAGLTLSNNVLGYDSSVISTKASTDALTTRVGTAETSITSLQNVSSGITLSNNVIGYDSTILATKSSVDALSTSKQDTITAGTGLTKTGATLSVNPAQTQITSVGTLTALSVNGYINITNTGSVALSIADNVSFGRCGSNTQWFSNAQTGDAIIRVSNSKVIRLGTNTNASVVDIFDGGMVVNSGNLTVAQAATLGNHVVNKTYVDGSFASIVSLNTTNTNITNLTGRVVSLETGGSTSKEITVWNKLKGSDTIPVILPPVGGAALTAANSTTTSWEYLNGTYNVNASSFHSAGYEAYRGFKSERLTAPWVSGNGTYNSTTGVYTTSTVSWIDANSTFVPGEWVAVALPGARTISSVTIYQRLGEPSPSMPLRIAVLVGQSTSTMTVAVDQDNIPDVPSHTLNFTGGSYKYIRLVCLKTRTPFTFCNFSFSLTTTTAGFPLALDHSQVRITSTEDSSSPTSGALQVAGGLSVQKSINIGTAMIPAGITTEIGGNTPLVNFESNFRSAGKNTTFGGAAVRIDTRGTTPAINFFQRAAGTTVETAPLIIDSNGSLEIQTATDSSSTTTGALRIAGGVGIAKKLNVGTSISVNGAPTACSRLSLLGPDNNITLGPHFTAYTSSNTAHPIFQILNWGTNNQSLNFDTYLGGGGTWTSSFAGSSSQIYKLSNALLFNWGVAPVGTTVPMTTAMRIDLTNGNVSILTATESSSTTTGALQVAGGVGIAKNVNVGGYVNQKLPAFFYCDNVTLANYQTLAANTETTIWLLPSSTYSKGPQPDANNALVIPTAGLWHFDLNMTITGFVGANNWFLQVNIAGTTQSNNIHRSFGQSNISAQFPNVYALVTGSIYLTLPAGAVVTMAFQPSVQCQTGNGCLARTKSVLTICSEAGPISLVILFGHFNLLMTVSVEHLKTIISLVTDVLVEVEITTADYLEDLPMFDQLQDMELDLTRAIELLKCVQNNAEQFTKRQDSLRTTAQINFLNGYKQDNMYFNRETSTFKDKESVDAIIKTFEDDPVFSHVPENVRREILDAFYKDLAENRVEELLRESKPKPPRKRKAAQKKKAATKEEPVVVFGDQTDEKE
ncbi:hypothetical protein DFJ77DRAFT_443827 [Powellomyces hirtus]|nr:hypothetical protein DFJ77DRAFT_443827 [Powellomyces hirtus]